MTVITLSKDSGTYKYIQVGTGEGTTVSEAINDFKAKYLKDTGIEWKEDVHGQLHVPLYESHPGL